VVISPTQKKTPRDRDRDVRDRDYNPGKILPRLSDFAIDRAYYDNELFSFHVKKKSHLYMNQFIVYN